MLRCSSMASRLLINILLVYVLRLGAALSCDSGKGICIDSNTETCGGVLVAGYCSGGSNILCCEPAISCDGNKGVCLDKSLQQCDGVFEAGYCPGNENIQCCEPLPDRCNGDGPPLINSSYLFTLHSQGFTGKPGALVYVPSNFNSESDDLDVVVYIHGFYNCIENIVRDKSHACNCSANSEIRSTYNLIDQFERAAIDASSISNNNWLFIAAEVAYDQANSSPGNWSKENLFYDYIDEILTRHLPKADLRVVGFSAKKVSRVRLFSHSGGYNVIADMVTVGGLPVVRNIVLFDSLYGSIDKFEEYVESSLTSCLVGSEYAQYRFASIYTATGGTYDNNNAMAKKIQPNVNNAEDHCDTKDLMWYSNEYTSLNQATIKSYSILYQLTSYSHDDVPVQFFYPFLVATA